MSSSPLPRGYRDHLEADLEALIATSMTATLLLTTLPDGWPHVAYLGPAEITELADGQLGLAVWAASRSTDAVLRSRLCTLQWVDDGTPLLVRLKVLEDVPLTVDGQDLVALRSRVAEVHEDRVPYASVEAGLRFRIDDYGEVLARWQRTRSALRQAFA